MEFYSYESSPGAILDFLSFNLRDKLIIYVRTFKEPLVSKNMCESVVEISLPYKYKFLRLSLSLDIWRWGSSPEKAVAPVIELL